MNESAFVSETAAGELCTSLEAQLTIFSSSFVFDRDDRGPGPTIPCRWYLLTFAVLFEDSFEEIVVFLVVVVVQIRG